jgi:hypothetical protein
MAKRTINPTEVNPSISRAYHIYAKPGKEKKLKGITNAFTAMEITIKSLSTGKENVISK